MQEEGITFSKLLEFNKDKWLGVYLSNGTHFNHVKIISVRKEVCEFESTFSSNGSIIYIRTNDIIALQIYND